jgi:uncharacterized alkaline shock family protein YloU
MSEIMSNIFGRSRNDVVTPGEQAANRRFTDTNTIDVEYTDVPAPGNDTTSTEDVADNTGTVEETASIADADMESDVDSDVESAVDAEADESADDYAENAESDADDADKVDDSDEADRAEIDEDATDETGTADADNTEDADEDAVVVTMVPLIVDSRDASVESDDAPAATESASDQSEPVAAASPPVSRTAAGMRGSTTVDGGVVAKVVNMVAGEPDGVYGLDDEGSSVAVDDDVATIRVALVVEYGHPVRALAEKVRINVVDALEQFLGLDVAAVDVHVSDIHQPEAG